MSSAAERRPPAGQPFQPPGAAPNSTGDKVEVAPMTRPLLLAALVCLPSLARAQAVADVTPLLTKELSGIPGKEAVVLTVEYAPGASDAVHRHNAHVFVYVLEGAVVMQARGGEEVRLTPGQTFYEAPSDVHVVGKNASTTERAKFLAFFVKDAGAPLLVPAR